jgi:uncharacterized membrane protein YphA (DoxX/SURF4 family)
MKFSAKFLSITEEILCFSLIVLFVYASLSKILDYENFRTELGQSPVLSAYAGIAALGVLIAELLTALFLAWRPFRKWALLASFTLMVMFTCYIIIILNFSDYIPCSCGGVLQRLGWRDHIIFNILFVINAGTGFFIIGSKKHKDSTKTFYCMKPRNILFSLLGALLGSAGFVVLLFLSSESAMQKENPFTRRFIPMSAEFSAEYKLDGYGYYFAGSYRDKIYLGNHSTPLYITEIDTSLRKSAKHKISLDKYDFPFRSAEVRIDYPYFFLYDGMVPVIFRGNISDFSSRTVMDKKIYFTDAAVINGSTFAIRGQKPPRGEYLAGLLQIGNEGKTNFFPDFLVKQQDGVFDTDGQFTYDKVAGKVIYVYYYRNEFTAADSMMQLSLRGRTIDTVSKAKLKIVTMEASGDTRLAAPPLMVNRQIAANNVPLFKDPIN